jgi:phosphoserine phosphatase
MDTGTYERILAVSGRLAATSDLAEVLDEVIDALRDLLGAERASVFQVRRDDAGAPSVFFATRAHGLPEDLSLPIDRGVIGEAAASRTTVAVHDARSHPSFNDAVDRATGFVTRQLLAVPLIDDAGTLVGVAQVLNKARGGSFDGEDETIARHLALQAAIAIRRAELLEHERERARLLADERAAHEIQSATLPGKNASAGSDAIGGWRIDGVWRPAERAAGDAWGVARRGDGRSCIVLLADATGHGVGPALSVSRVSAMLGIAAEAGLPLHECAAAINNRLVEELPTGLFVTGLFAEISDGCSEIAFVSAGQAPLVLVKRKGVAQTFGSGAPPLGVERWEEPHSIVQRAALEAGDVFIAASDGVYDALGATSPIAGRVSVVEHCAKQMLGYSDAGARIAEALLDATRDAAADDRTIVVVQRGVSGAQQPSDL